MQLTGVGRGREQIGSEQLEGLRARETHLSELIGQRADIWRSLLLAVDRLLSVSRCGAIVALGLSVVRRGLGLLGLELTVAHKTWGEKLGRSEWLLRLRTAASRIGVSGVSVCGAIVGLGLSCGVLASFWMTVGWRR